MDFKKQKPIYQQIADTLCERVVGGELTAEARMPSVRDVAVQLGVNPNTVMRTFEYLQQTGVIYNKRGIGYFVAADATEKITELQKETFFNEELPAFIQRMKLLNISQDDLKRYCND